MSQPPKTMSFSSASGTSSLMSGDRPSVRFPSRMVPIWVNEPIGLERPLRMAKTPAIVVVLTAPRPTRRMPSRPSDGAIEMPFISGRNYIIRIMLPWLFRRPATSFDTSHQTELAMVGARAGERVIVLGARDPGLAAALARVTGADGELIVVDDDADAPARPDPPGG